MQAIDQRTKAQINESDTRIWNDIWKTFSANPQNKKTFFGFCELLKYRSFFPDPPHVPPLLKTSYKITNVNNTNRMNY